VSIFGDRLREERGLAGLSGRKVAEQAGLDPTHVHKIEHGRRRVVMPSAEAITDALGLTLADLLLEGPRLFDLEYAVGADLDLPPSPEIEQHMLDVVPRAMLPRVAVWPWTGDGSVRLRARASCLPGLVALAGLDVPGLGRRLPAPTVRAVGPCSELIVLVQAAGSRAARRTVLTEAARVDCCPPVAITNRGPSLWLARLRSVPQAGSLALQRLSAGSPIGLFVPG